MTVLIWPIGFLGNRRRRRELGAPTGSRIMPWAARFVAWDYALMTVVILAGIASLIVDLEAVAFGLPPALMMLVSLHYFTAGLAAMMAGFAVWAWLKGWWTLIGRLHYTLLVVVAAALTWWQSYWNLLMW